jgi:hypothetical protein
VALMEERRSMWWISFPMVSFCYLFLLYFIYSSVENTWTVATLSEARMDLCGTWASQFVFFAGGHRLNVFLDTIDIYDLGKYLCHILIFQFDEPPEFFIYFISVKFLDNCHLNYEAYWDVLFSINRLTSFSCLVSQGLFLIVFLTKLDGKAFFAGGQYQYSDPLNPSLNPYLI